MADTVFKKYTLLTGENTYSSPVAMDPGDARRLQSLIPSLAGYLEREHPTLPFTPDAPFSAPVRWFHQFKRNNSGTFVYFFFCATATTLYVCQNPLTGGTWQVVSAVPLGGIPVAVNINNQMQLDDAAGGRSWLFDGTTWVKNGLALPVEAPRFSVSTTLASASITSLTLTNGILSVVLTAPLVGSKVGYYVTLAGAGVRAAAVGTFPIATWTDAQHFTISLVGNMDGMSGAVGTATEASLTILVNRFYWTTYSDQSATHAHESSSSGESLGTGPQATPCVITVQQRAGSLASNAGAVVTGMGTDFSSTDVGKSLFFAGGVAGAVISIPIVAVANAQSLTLASAPTTAITPS